MMTSLWLKLEELPSVGYPVRYLDKLLPLPICLAALDCPLRPPDTFFPAPTSWSDFPDDLSIVAVTHVARIRVADTADYK